VRPGLRARVVDAQAEPAPAVDQLVDTAGLLPDFPVLVHAAVWRPQERLRPGCGAAPADADVPVQQHLLEVVVLATRDVLELLPADGAPRLLHHIAQAGRTAR
jgi:hypothetical protein